MKPWKLILHLQSDNGKLFKQETIRKEAESGNDEFFAGLKLTFHPLITFGVKRIPWSNVGLDDEKDLAWDKFAELTTALANRELTGHAARDAIIVAMESAGKDQWDFWYRHILIQDMRAGFTESTVNKAVKEAKRHPDYTIPVFACMLAHDSAKHEKKLVGKKQIEIKLDGVRVLTVIKANKGGVIQTTRNGRELHNFGHTKDQLMEMDFPVDTVLDGEIMSDNFQDLMTQVNRTSDVDAGDAVLHVFDILPLDEFLDGKSTLNQVARSSIVEHCGKIYNFQHVRFLSSEVVDLDTDDGRARYKEINQQAIDGGYEGIMLKDLESMYECKRSAHWLKLKPFITVDLIVTGMEEGEGKYEGTLGALVCTGTDDGKEISVSVGSGLTDAMRDLIWNATDPIGIVEIKADAITQSRDKDTYSLRFPRFVRFRGFDEQEKM